MSHSNGRAGCPAQRIRSQPRRMHGELLCMWSCTRARAHMHACPGDVVLSCRKPLAILDAVDAYKRVLWLDAGSTVTAPLRNTVWPLLLQDGHFLVQVGAESDSPGGAPLPPPSHPAASCLDRPPTQHWTGHLHSTQKPLSDDQWLQELPVQQQQHLFRRAGSHGVGHRLNTQLQLEVRHICYIPTYGACNAW